MLSTVLITIDEFRQLLLALAEYADDAADMGRSEYNWDKPAIQRAWKYAKRARELDHRLAFVEKVVFFLKAEGEEMDGEVPLRLKPPLDVLQIHDSGDKNVRGKD